jgi:hypothetical protein
MKNLTRVVCMTGLLLAATHAFAADPAATVKCEMKFTMKGWSALYKRASGTGTVSCSNGQSANVKLEARGGGLTARKSSQENGHGQLTPVKVIEQKIGAYADAEAHAGAVKSSGARAMTKGEVSLALNGTGRGWDLGVAFGKFKITRQ